MKVPGVLAPNRDPAVDLLRGVAISLVLLLHFSLTYRLTKSPLADWLGEDGVRALVVNGNFGVTIFFAVSGYLIASQVIARDGALGRIDLRAFYARRIARILPLLALALALIVPLGLLGVPSFMNVENGRPRSATFMWLALGSIVTFTQNVLMQSAGYFNYALNVYWSLSVEEVFYLGFPLLCALVRQDRAIVPVCAFLMVAGPGFRMMHADDEILYMYAYTACFDAIAFGVLTALMVERTRGFRRLPPAWREQSAEWHRRR